MAPLLTSAQVAAQFGVDDESVRRWVKTGKLPAVRTPGGRYRFRAEDVQQFLDVEVSPATDGAA